MDTQHIYKWWIITIYSRNPYWPTRMGHCWWLGRPVNAQFYSPTYVSFCGWGVGWGGLITFIVLRSGHDARLFLRYSWGWGGGVGEQGSYYYVLEHDAPDFSKNVQYYVKVATSLAKNIPGCLCKENMTGTCLGIAKSSWNVQFSGVLNQTIECKMTGASSRRYDKAYVLHSLWCFCNKFAGLLADIVWTRP